ncbi:Ig-like domain-containing protein [Mycolicibacterium sp. 120266]|uniref:Ig-like domain-containing protein n=1 Tax=Mycolicibacterium sp. 120266 TaxID=3090601 RepID=UPI00299F15A7|nr:Ig-like domain-containing protein [Mycolicibacterium sp. 120266]MDX1873539.1 Ig-like domain-containing protein [Mycolicibacterium sp. 120266]
MNDARICGHARYVGRIGALAVALGIGVGLTALPAVAWAEPDTSSAETSGTGTAGTAGTPDTGSTTAAEPQTAAATVTAAEIKSDTEQKSDKPTTKKNRKAAPRSSTRTAKKAAPSTEPQTTSTATAPAAKAATSTAAAAAPATAPSAPTVTAAVSSVVQQPAPTLAPRPTTPPLVKAVQTFLTALTAPFLGGGSVPHLEFPGLWVLMAAARRELGLSDTPVDTTARSTETQTVSALSLTAAATATVTNQPPQPGTTTLGNPDPTTGAVTGQVHATDPEGKAVTFALVTPPTLGTVKFSSTGAFTYTPTAAQRVQAGLGSVPDAVFRVTAYDGSTAKVPFDVSVPIDPTPVQLLSPVGAGQSTAVAATNTRAYLTNSAAGTLTVVNTLDGTVVTTITVGTNPTAVAVRPDGKYVYVADTAGKTISVIDAATNTVKRTIGTSATPTSLAISPSGGTLFIGNATGKVAKFSTSTNSITGWISNTVGATSVVLSPDGKKLYATTPAGVAVYTTSSWTNSAKVLAIPGTSPTAVAAGTDGSRLYVVTDGSTVKVLETAKYTVVDQFQTTAPVRAATVNKDGSLLLVTATTGEVTVYNAKTNALLTTLDTGDTVSGIAASPDGMQLYTAGGSAMRVVSLVPTNTKPVADKPITTSSAVTGVVSGSTGVTDADADPLKITVLSAPVRGKVTFSSDGTFTYTPTAAARHKAAADTAPSTDLSDSFTFTVDDGRRGVVQQTITVTVVPANKVPTVKTTVGKANSSTGVITGSVKGTDGDADRIYYEGTVSTLQGTAVVKADGTFTYTPTITARHAAAAVTGPTHDTFTVTVDDGHGAVLQVPVTVNVLPRNTAPTAATVSTPAVSAYTGRVTGRLTTTDADGDTLTYTSAGPAKGTVVLNPDGSFSYTPSAAARAAGTSTDTFAVTISDGHGGSRAVTVTVAVTASTPGNDLPVAATNAYVATVDSSTGVVTGQVNATDSTALTYLLNSTIASTVGSVVVNGDGTFTFTPSTAARYHSWFTPQADVATFTVAAYDGRDGIPVDVAVPITALHPDADGTLTLAELKTLAGTGDVDVSKNANGTVRNIDGTFTVATVSDAASAAAVLNKVAALLGAPAGFADASRIAVSSNAFGGDVFYRLTQRVGGLEVLGSEVVLATDSTGRVTGLVSNYDSALGSVNTTPTPSLGHAADAEAIVRNDLLTGLAGTPSQATKDAFLATLQLTTDLVIYDQDVSENLNTLARFHPAALAWRVVVDSAPDSPYPSEGVTYFIYANGSNAGTIFSEFSSAQQALSPLRSSGTDLLGATRTVGAGNTGSALVLSDPTRNITTYTTTYVSSGWPGQPSIPGTTVTYTTSWGTAAVSAQANMARVYDYYSTVLGRTSFDDNGAPIVLSIDYNPSGSAAAGWRNAAWNGSELVFGDSGATQAALDLVGHEYTHAVIQYVNGLAYLGESGALNEGYADIMGALIENKTGSGRWLFAEDAAGNPYRSMQDPSAYGQPETYGGRYVDPCGCHDNTTDDFDYVHSNSGILTFAAYKMMDATKNEVSGEQWARVFYESLYRMPSTARFVDARYAVIASARANGFTASQIAAIKTAFDAVGVTASAL